MDEKYNSRFNHSNQIQEFFVEYLENKYGYDFMAGDRNGKTVNIDFIEEVCRAEYKHPILKVSGPMLNINGLNFTMPDELMLLKSKNKLQWFEVKSRTLKTLYEKYETLKHYLKIQERTGIPVFVGVVIFDKEMERYRVFVRNIKSILEGILENKTSPRKRIYFELEKFKEI